MEKTKKPTEKQKQVLRELVNFTCELCGKKDEKLEIHRMQRGNRGGLYIPSNIKLLCNSCHKRVHSQEFR